MTLAPGRLLLPAILVTALALTGCSGGHGSDSTDSGGSAGSASSSSLIGEPAARGAADTPEGSASAAGTDTSEKTDPVVAQEQALVRTGHLELRSGDVAHAQRQVQKVVDTYAGQVTDQHTTSDRHGSPTYARMVLRIPSEDFDRAVEALRGVGTVDSVKTNQDDVTTQVIDVRTRLRVQKRSIARITVLFARATSIRDIMAIEAQLSQRQADLEALEQQAAYLQNQTSLSTIVVSIDQIAAKHATAHTDDAGFVAGLRAGWGALAAFAVGLATAAGAALPWLVVVAVLGLPTLLLVRALRRRTTSVVGAAEAPQSSE